MKGRKELLHQDAGEHLDRKMLLDAVCNIAPSTACYSKLVLETHTKAYTVRHLACYRALLG